MLDGNIEQWFTAVNAATQLELFFRQMRNLEVADGAEQMKGHRRDDGRVTDAVTDRKSTDHHVLVADRLYLATAMNTCTCLLATQQYSHAYLYFPACSLTIEPCIQVLSYV